MILELPVLLLIFAAVVGAGSMAGVLGWMFHRLSRIEGGAGGDGPALASLEADFKELGSQLQLLEERVTFSERLLEATPRNGADLIDAAE